MFVQDLWLWSVTHLRPPCWRNISPQEWDWFSTKSFPMWLMYIFHLKKVVREKYRNSMIQLIIQSQSYLVKILTICAFIKFVANVHWWNYAFSSYKICLQGCFHHGSKVQISELSVSFGKHMVGRDTTFWLLCHQFPFLLSVNFHLCMSHRMIHGHSLHVINVVDHLVQWGVL